MYYLYYKATQCLLTCEYVYVLAGAVLGQKIWIRDSRHHFYIYTQNISWQKSLNTKYLKMRLVFTNSVTYCLLRWMGRATSKSR